jgi:hypothetical protein
MGFITSRPQPFEDDPAQASVTEKLVEVQLGSTESEYDALRI